jgi:hypothetical protein
MKVRGEKFSLLFLVLLHLSKSFHCLAFVYMFALCSNHRFPYGHLCTTLVFYSLKEILLVINV